MTTLLVEQFATALNVADYGYMLETGSISLHEPAEGLKNDPNVIAAYLSGGIKAARTNAPAEYGFSCNKLMQATYYLGMQR